MNAPVQTYPLPARFSRWLLGCAVRHWPEESRVWGAALAAEIDETKNIFESLLWLWGGIMLFARSVMGSILTWLKLPAGSGAGCNVGDPSNLPRRSRLLTAVVLIAVAALFLSPEGREATTALRASWSNGFWDQSPSDRQALEKLADRAEKDNDATTLAFVALSLDDPHRAPNLADHAVSLNPGFVWIYAGRGLASEGSPTARKKRVERLEGADPGNAVPLIVAAEYVAEQSGLVFPEHMTPGEVEAKLAGNPEWMALMTRALSLTRYDTYEQRRVQLTSGVWSHELYLSPSVVYRGLWLNANPGGDLGIFSRIRVHQAEKAFAAGDPKEAERLLGEVASFGERIANNEGTPIWDKFTGVWMAREAVLEMEKLYTKAGSRAQIKETNLRLKKLDEAQAQLAARVQAESVPGRTFPVAGMFVQGFGVLAIASACIALSAILMLELWPARFLSHRAFWRTAVCRTADLAPIASLVAGGALLASFAPFARAFETYRTTSTVDSGQILGHALMGGLSWYWGWEWRAECVFLIWCCGTALLAAFAIFVVARSMHRARAVAVAMTIAAGLAGTSYLRAQDGNASLADRPSFATVSIKLDKSSTAAPSHQVYYPNRFVATLTARQLIEYAYGNDASHGNGPGLNDDEVAGGPDWVTSETYDIDAQGADSPAESDEQWMQRVRPMARLLLAERFKLKIRHEMRDLPAYALVVAKDGPKLLEVRSDANQGGVRAMGIGKFQFTATTPGNLGWVLSNRPDLARRPVLDRTALDGYYSFTFQAPAADNAALSQASPAALSAALDDQLGLSLEPATTSMDTIIIEHIERPAGQ